jgi:hypothetical protein
LGDQKKIDIMQRLEAAVTESAIVRVQLATAAQRVRQTGAEALPRSFGERQNGGFLVYRGKPGRQERISADGRYRSASR